VSVLLKYTHTTGKVQTEADSESQVSSHHQYECKAGPLV
jgi:hypothetical protein